MTSLTIENFSCIKSGTVTASQFTVLIGPQASGKSVIAKLIHFFNDTLARPVHYVTSDYSFETFLARTSASFREQFPESAWGKGEFRLEFRAGPYGVTVTRNPKAPEQLHFEFNDSFLSYRKDAAGRFEQIRLKARADPTLPIDFEKYWPVQQTIEELQRRNMGNDYVWHQLFVPAGRSFFTTLGKTSVALGNSVVTDTFTQRFGRLITSLRDEPFADARLHPTASAILGGEVVKEGDVETLLSPDGRRIPLSLMSSGQQEFFPLATTLSYARMIATSGLWVFIEEPEAHLFPKAQSELVDLLVDTASADDSAARMIVTTHSPYVMSKLNNLLKAGTLAEARPDLKDKIGKVIPSQRWLSSRNFIAYAIDDGIIVPLVDDDGLIDAGYLDSVSSSLANQFGEMLDLEYAS